MMGRSMVQEDWNTIQCDMFFTFLIVSFYLFLLFEKFAEDVAFRLEGGVMLQNDKTPIKFSLPSSADDLYFYFLVFTLTLNILCCG